MALLFYAIVSLVMLAVVAAIGVATVRALQGGGSGDRRVRELEAEVADLRRRLDQATPALTTAPDAWPTLSAGVEPVTVGNTLVPADLVSRVGVLLRGNQKIQAIKEVRTATGLGLKEAKDLVEDLGRRGV